MTYATTVNKKSGLVRMFYVRTNLEVEDMTYYVAERLQGEGLLGQNDHFDTHYLIFVQDTRPALTPLS